MDILQVLLIIVLSYLLGSTPTAYLVARYIKNVNIFEVGSGNMGATNVIRAVGWFWGMVVLCFDSLKGIIAVLISQQLLPENVPAATTISAIVAIVGHNWSLFATLITGHIRGGKGAATAFGTLLMIAPVQVIVVTCATCGAIIAVTRYMSLGVLVLFAFAFSWLLVLILQNQLQPEFLVYCLMVAAMILYRFRENIQRLMTGTERRLGETV